MKNISDVLIYLNLAAMGFIAPIISVLLAFFQLGVNKLKSQYEAQKSQSEENLKNQLKAESESETANIEKIKITIQELENQKKIAQKKLEFLDPKKQLLKMFVPLAISLFSFALFNASNEKIFRSLFIENEFIFNILLIIVFLCGLFFLLYGILIMNSLIKIILEVKAKVDDDFTVAEKTKVELLSKIAHQSQEPYLEKVYPNINKKDINNNSTNFDLNVNEEFTFSLAIDNHEIKMAKHIELGIVFPSNFLLVEETSLKLYRDEKQQIIRYDAEMIQGSTLYLVLPPIKFKPLEKGMYKVKTFIKGENILVKYFEVSCIVS
jgi:hypothetical protein